MYFIAIVVGIVVVIVFVIVFVVYFHFQVTCLQFCDDKIVSGSDDTTLKIWSAITGEVSTVHSLYIVQYVIILFC